MADAETRLRDILQCIARDHEYSNSDIALNPISTGGANYTSVLFAATVSGQGKEDLKLFSKVATLGEKMRSMTTLSVFETEFRFYTRLLPKYRELEETHRIPMKERLVLPKYFGGSTQSLKELLVLEDLSAAGYQTMHRFECFDWEYASRSVSALARFHALSVAFQKSDPVAYSDLTDDLTFDYPADQNYLNKGIMNAVNATDEKYKARVEKFLQDDLKMQVFTKFCHSQRRQIVLCHGDFRPSNILHKVNEDGSLNIAIVDYQIIRRGNPVDDLMFFLICGADERFWTEHLHQFFDHYYESFNRALQSLNMNPQEVYPEKEYRDDIQQILRYGLTVGVYCLPFITVETENAPKPEDCIDVENFDLQVGSRFRDRFNGLVRSYMKLGIL